MALHEKYISPHALASILFILLFYWLWSRRHFYTFALHFPGKLGLPFIGVLYRVKSVDFLLSFLGELFKDCNANTIYTWCGLYPVLITQDPIVAEKVLSSSKLLTKATPMYNAMNEALEGGILTSPASEWRSHRKLINPAFSQKVLLSFFPIFNKGRNKIVEILHNYSNSIDSGEINLSGIIQTNILKIATETILGSQKTLKESDINIFMRSYTLIFRRVLILTVHSFLNIYNIFKWNRSYKKVLNGLKNLLKYHLYEELRSKSEDSEMSKDNKTDVKPSIFIDIISESLKEGKLSLQEVKGESITMMIGSIETTSNALFSAIVMLAMHPSVQKRLYDEISTVYKGDNIEVEYEHLAELRYLEMVVHETLRLAPSVPIIGRQITEPTEIKDGVIVPEGVQIIISIFHIHRNKHIWGPNADKFNPDNFLPENQATRHSHAYIPFSKGVRNCIGYRYAIFALKIMLIGLIHNFEFDTDFKYEELQFVDYMTLAYMREPHIMIKPRKFCF